MPIRETLAHRSTPDGVGATSEASTTYRQELIESGGGYETAVTGTATQDAVAVDAVLQQPSGSDQTSMVFVALSTGADAEVTVGYDVSIDAAGTKPSYIPKGGSGVDTLFVVDEGGTYTTSGGSSTGFVSGGGGVTNFTPGGGSAGSLEWVLAPGESRRYRIANLAADEQQFGIVVEWYDVS